jgi:alanine dehydrogenase
VLSRPDRARDGPCRRRRRAPVEPWRHGPVAQEHEHRLPLHPQHLGRIPDDLRERIYLEGGYGDRFGSSEDQLKGWVAGFRTREQLIEECDVILQPKPLLSEIAELRVGQVLWGWPHCVQDEELTQVAIDHKLTLIAFEAMNHWHRDGSFQPACVPQEQ